MSFKHSLIINGSEQKRDKFKAELSKLGYAANATREGEDWSTVVGEVRSLMDAKRNSFTEYVFPLTSNEKADFEFDIDEEWQYAAALAIASIHEEDDIPFVGEWIYCGENSATRTGHREDDLAKLTNANELGGITTYNHLGNNYDSHLNMHGNRKATPDEIIEFFKNKYMYDSTALAGSEYAKATVNKLLGYRIIKDGPGFKKGLELTVRTFIKGGDHGYSTPVIGGPKHRVRFPDDVLADTEWFEPIYEKVVREIKVMKGSRSDEFIIREDGTITCKRIGDFNIKAVEDIISYYGKNNHDLSVIGYTVSIKSDWRNILVGCESEDHRFSLGELRDLVNTYNQLKNS